MTGVGPQVTMQGNPLDLLGSLPAVTTPAPDFTVLTTGLEPKKLNDFKGKALIIATVPSVDTSVCSMEAKRFNDEVQKLGDGVEVWTISMDLPFALDRWAKENNVEHLTMLSDHAEADFGTTYGVLIPALRLLARAVFVIGPDQKIAYHQLVSEITDEPNYEEVLDAVKKLT